MPYDAEDQTVQGIDIVRLFDKAPDALAGDPVYTITYTIPDKVLTRDPVYTERLTQLRDAVARTPPHNFSMQRWIEEDERGTLEKVVGVVAGYPWCGTVACIGGSAQLLFGLRDPTMDEVGEYLGLCSSDTDDLFYPPDDHDGWDATPTQAARVIDHLIQTGEVDWTRMGEP